MLPHFTESGQQERLTRYKRRKGQFLYVFTVIVLTFKVVVEPEADRVFYLP